MDVKDIFQWLPQSVSRFAPIFADALSRPGLYFPPVEELSADSGPADGDAKQRWRPDPELITFVFGCIVIGSILNELMRGRLYGGGSPIDLAVEKPGLFGLVSVIVVVTLFWFAFSFLTFLFCKLLGGRGTWLETVSLSLQYFAINNVLANFLALLWVMLGPSPAPWSEDLLSSFWCWITGWPDRMYFLVQFVLLSIYLTRAIGTIHGFGHVKQGFVGIFTASMTVTIGYIFYENIAPIHMG